MFETLVDFSSPGDLYEKVVRTAWEPGGGPTTPGEDAESGRSTEVESAEVITSAVPRGLALRRLVINGGHDGPLGWLRQKQHVYFLSVALDASGDPPVVMPPAELKAFGFDPMYEVPHSGGSVEMTLGDGAPVFLPRPIVGGLAVYVLVCEADSLHKVGETMEKIHSSVTDSQGDLLERVTRLVTRPGNAVAGEVLSAATTLLQPIAAVLRSSGDDFVGLVQGTFPATRSWEGRLTQDFAGGSVMLAEVTA